MIKLIRKLEGYGQLSDEERRAVEEAPSRIEDYGPREEMIREGDTPGEICLMLEGFSCRYRLLPNGARQILSLQLPGDFCDLHSFLLKTMDHSIAAVPTCKVAKISHDRIYEITERFPRLTRALWWDVAIDGAIFREWMVSMGRRSAYQQMAHLICELLLRLRSVGLTDDDSYDMPPTQTELGDALGLSTVHVNRVLQELRGNGLITLEGKRLTIIDLDGLKKAAGFTPGYLHLRGVSGSSSQT